MSHPPIPPKCEEFFCAENPGMFSALGHDYDLYTPEPKCRRIIAAVARCAWLDEVFRLEVEFSDRSFKCLNTSKVYSREAKEKIETLFDDLTVKLHQVRATAAAWREWGENISRGEEDRS